MAREFLHQSAAVRTIAHKLGSPVRTWSTVRQLFMDGDIDIRIPATALRVMVAHGSFTPTGTDSLTKAGAEALQRLSDVLLQECERRFGAWLHEMLAKRDEAA